LFSHRQDSGYRRLIHAAVASIAALAMLALVAPLAFGKRRDRDRDGLSNRFELKRSHTNPRARDTDRDGLSDGFELRRSHTNPRRADSDGDGLVDGYEVRRSRTSPHRKDTDGDGTTDTVELLAGTDPTSKGKKKGQQPPPLDLTPPETTITSGPTGTVTSGDATFAFSSSESGSSFECSLDGAPWGRCSSPRSQAGLANGTHKFDVRAIDSASNTDASPAERAWTVQVASDPPPPPPPPPPAPTADFTISPSPANPGQQVTFDWTGSCAASPCSFDWEDEGPDGPGGDEFPWGTGDPLTRSFQVVGTKYAHLIVTDQLGRTAESRQQLQVVDPAPPPPPPPPPPPAAACSDGQDNDADGKVDYPADPGCTDASDTDESDVVIPPPSGSCDLNATPSNFASQVSAATAGQTICLASGSYGTWTGTNKAITIRAATGATPTMRYSFGSGDSGFTLDGMTGMGGTFTSGASNVTVKNSAFNTCAQFDGSMTNVVFDGNTHLNINATCGNSRLGLNASGVTIRNSLMQGGDSDGAFVSANNVLVENNRFIDLCDVGGNHTDGLQFADPGDPSGGWNAVVRGNFFSFNGCPNDYAQALSSYDGGTNGALLEDNVVDTTRPGGIELYADQGSIVRHNTVRWYPSTVCAFNAQCGYIEVTRKSADPASVNTQVYDNVARVSVSMGSTVARNDHNVSGESVTFVGPLNTYGGFRLAAGSAGKGAASDGLDVGVR
jgi:parallel beta helix pectate lyase-like protein/thrombospondin type 3 repeat protein